VLDRDAIASEVAGRLPGLMDPLEGDDGMHTLDTVDYGILLEGELVLTLDNEEEVTLTPGACVASSAPGTLGRTVATTRRSCASYRSEPPV
jgi:hypothetical protein